VTLKSFFLLLIFICIASTTHAQARSDSRDSGKRIELLERYKSQKIAYLTNKLSLTSDEATKFWPVYNQYADEKEELHKKVVEEIKAQRSNERDSDTSLSKMFAFKEEELSIEKKYTTKFKEAISSYKILRLFHHEKEFKKELVDKMKSRMRDKRTERN
jgi:hypothetical protein